MFRLTMKILGKDIKASIFYVFVMTLTIAIHFLFTCSSGAITLGGGNTLPAGLQMLADRYHLLNQTGSSAMMPADLLNGVVVFFCCFLMFYMNRNYIFNKRKEVAILKVSGASMSQIILFLSLLLILSFIPGIFAGYKCANLFFSLTGSGDLSLVSQNFREAVILLSIILVYLLFYIIVFTYRIDIKELLSTRNNIKVINEAPERKNADVIFLLMYIIAISLIMVPVLPVRMLSLTLVFVFAGIYGTANGFITRTVQKLKKGKLLGNRYLMVSASNYSSTLLSNKVTILSMICSVIVMFYIMMSCLGSVANFVLSLIGYLIAVVLLSFTVTFDLTTQAKQRSVYYVNLFKIGYTRKELIKVIGQEMLMLYLTIIVTTLLVITPLGFRHVLAGHLDGELCLLLLGFYLFFVLFTAVMSYLIYRHTVISNVVVEK